MSTHYLAELPVDGYCLDTKTMIVTQDVFDQLADYSRSLPTNPKPGRVYKKNLGWAPEDPDWWWAFICRVDPMDNTLVEHRPFKLVVAPGGVLPELRIPENSMGIQLRYRYGWNAKDRCWTRTGNHQRAPYERGYTDADRVDPSNKFVGPLSKPITEADCNWLLKDMLRRRRIREANLARPFESHERFVRELVVA